MIYMSSDYHLNHDREFIWKARGFQSVEEMNEAIVERNNSMVTDDDILIICGDVMLGGADKLEKGIELLKRMNGKKLIVTGNHDTPARRKAYLGINIPVFDAYAFVYKHHNLYFSHYPTLTSNLNEESLKQMTLNFYGHTHQTTNFYDDRPYMYHIGADSHDCYPVLLDNALKEMKEKINECKEGL